MVRPSDKACTAVVGLQWGDEGKGKIVELLAAEHDAVVRYNGGANAGHSLVVNGERFAVHLVPSGILYNGKLSVIGNGVVVDAGKLIEEIDGLRERGISCEGLVVSDRAHVVMPYHKAEDALREELLKEAAEVHSGALERAGNLGEIGTTRRGIGPAYADKARRATAVRMGDMLRPDVLREKIGLACRINNALFRELTGEADRFDAAELTDQVRAHGERLADSIEDTTYLLNDRVADGGRLLFEGANATLLDVDHGTYPFVTSSSTTALGIGPGTGVPETHLGRVLGVVKAYQTRVGAGPMPTELFDGVADRIRDRGREFGTTTGRPRRCGWLDAVATRYSAMINGTTGICLMLLDVLAGFDELKVCVGHRYAAGVTDRFRPDSSDLAVAEPVYETLPGFGDEITEARSWDDLPENARGYVEFVERAVGVPVDFVSVGPDRAQTIRRSQHAGVAS